MSIKLKILPHWTNIFPLSSAAVPQRTWCYVLIPASQTKEKGKIRCLPNSVSQDRCQKMPFLNSLKNSQCLRGGESLFKYKVIEFIRDLIVSHKVCAFLPDLQIKVGWLPQQLKKFTTSPSPVVALQVSTSMHDL